MTRAHHRRNVATAVLAIAAGLAAACTGPRGASPPATVLNLQRPSDGEWFGLYLGDQKVGASHLSVQVEERDGAHVLVSREAISLIASVGDGVARMTSLEEKVYEARPGGRLLSFSRRLRSAAGAALSIDGRCTPEGCVASIDSGGRREERALPPVHETAEMADAERLAAARRAEVAGVRLVLETLKTVETRVRWTGADVVRSGDTLVEVGVVEEWSGSEGAPARYAFASDGRLVQLRLGRMTGRAEPRAEALALRELVDLAGTTRVRLPSDLPRAVPGRLRFRLRGLPRPLQLGDARQAWAAQPDGSSAVTVTARAPAAGTPGRDTPRGAGAGDPDAPFLDATLTIDSDSPAIQAAAREIIGERAGRYDASVAILRHLHGRIATSSAMSTARASETLERGRATSEERAHLFTALARAAGVPARVVGGLVYAKYSDNVPALYWRAWVEVRSAGEWIALDPELGQPIADPTHIKLSVDERSLVVSVAGTLEVLSVSEVGPAP